MPLKDTTLWKFLFGRQLTPQEMIRNNQKLINKAIRNVDRERNNLDRLEQKQLVEIKRTAQKNQPVLVRALANDLVRIRNHICTLLKMRQQLQAVSIQLQTLETQRSISQAIYHATLSLRGMNTSLNMPRIREVLKEFEKQSQIMGLKGEMIGEVMDGVNGCEDDTEESEEIISRVLDELGIQIERSLPEAPHKVKPGFTNGKVQLWTSVDADDDLLARLETLKRSSFYY